MTPFEQDARFSAALEECCRRVQRGEALEQCLDDYPREYREEIARLALLVGRLAQASRDPSAEFQARLERRLLAAVEGARRAQRTGLLGYAGRFFSAAPAMRAAMVALAALIIVAGGSLGAVQASENSLPDSPLYQVKEAREWVELTIAQNEESQVGVRVTHVGKRDHELERAILAGKPRRVIDPLINRIASSVERTVDKALESSSKGNFKPVNRARVLLRTTQRHVDRLMGQASPEDQPALQQLRSFLDEQERRLPESKDRTRNPRMPESQPQRKVPGWTTAPRRLYIAEALP